MTTFLGHLTAEPDLEEVLDDPIVRMLMRGDGTGENEVRRLIAKIRAELTAELEADGTVPGRERAAGRASRAGPDKGNVRAA